MRMLIYGLLLASLLLGACDPPAEPVNRQSKLSVYPNPTDGEVSIGLSGLKSERHTLQILDTQGRIFYEEVIENRPWGSFHKRLDNEPKGYYHVVLKSADEVLSVKLLKQ